MSGLIKTAKGIYYDNTDSGLAADRVQEAIDENAAGVVEENTWDRDTVGDSFLIQHNLGDDLKLKQAGGDVVLDMDVSAETLQIGKTTTAGVIRVKDINNVAQETLSSVGANNKKGLSQQIGTGSAGPIDYSMADDGFLDITSGKKGWYKIVVGDNEEDANFNFSADGTVDLIDNSANVVATDTDTKFCIFDNGTNVRIRNRLGSTKVIQINGYYS